ncbi:BrxA/BrxB family bacilliredoxin [Rhodohalobacter halophilus]|uniref:BrxA/BrxB family bacilliredoxin n=1 Tax=Rhodohalobacter halophilus TaxID=1812810 RepID=UPI00083F9E46|nr:BrxA/BrxB family bacilliredoxin [Rhodohalobacter halophilus]
MQFGFGVGPDTSWMREELTDLGVEELKTPEDVDRIMKEYNEGTMLMVINSVCGCAAGNARPAVGLSLEKTDAKPDHLVTVFAGQDKEATARAREYFSEYPPSSPAFAYFVDGEIKAMIPRHRIEGRSKEEVAEDLLMVYNAFSGEDAE